MGFRYASDTRGTHPFIPVIRAEIIGCPQFPTTLPTLDEMIGLDGVTEANVHEALLEKTREPRDHVYTLHAELEGMKLAPTFDKLLEGWKAQGYELVAMRDLVAATEPATIPMHSVIMGTVPGRSGTLACQSAPFLPQ
jgi:peptidoglycan/xylan/chitin deacetylase (PgdA/CDA1 family)